MNSLVFVVRCILFLFSAIAEVLFNDKRQRKICFGEHKRGIKGVNCASQNSLSLSFRLLECLWQSILPEMDKSKILKVRNTYRWYAKYYDYVLKVFNPIFAASAEKEFNKLLEKYVKDGAHILDVGVGTGFNIQRILDHKISFDSYEGIDLTPEMLTVARRKFGHIRNMTLHTGDVTTLKFTKKYDAIICTLVFSHLEKQDEVLKKLLAALHPNGVLLLLFFTAKPHSGFIDSIALWIYRKIFHFGPVPASAIKKFPPSKIEQHFPCWGGRISLYVFDK